MTLPNPEVLIPIPQEIQQMYMIKLLAKSYPYRMPDGKMIVVYEFEGKLYYDPT